MILNHCVVHYEFKKIGMENVIFDIFREKYYKLIVSFA